MSILEQILLTDKLYWAVALGGSALFVLRLVSMLFGLGDEDSDDGDFKLLTVHSLSGFAMLFGWIGLACQKEAHLGPGWSCLAALGAGSGMLFLTRWIFIWAGSAVSKGGDFEIKEAIGKQATVYQKIPGTGTGKVQVTVNEVMYELLAVSKENCEIHSFECVDIVDVLDEQTVVVRK
ncbi:MAG: hypothetical protein KDK44_04165 [Chlamydiia bacterium]|nr:hypothetical protein [Chlamydiia bacterium]MCP5508896.1 hypothetical protein [Chlamydiales bacterium]HPE84714.1 hypothetical protein [Chlamydiales bacterium]